jgi:hypothetical protein
MVTMKNIDIYNAANGIAEAFNDATQYLPIKINFYIQKNKAILMALAQDIETSRLSIIQNYGAPTEDGEHYRIPNENLDIVQQELNDLFMLEQEVGIYKVDIDTLPDDISLTTGQMEALMFMFN